MADQLKSDVPLPVQPWLDRPPDDGSAFRRAGPGPMRSWRRPADSGAVGRLPVPGNRGDLSGSLKDAKEAARARITPPVPPLPFIREEELERLLALERAGQFPVVVTGYRMGVSALLAAACAAPSLAGQTLWVTLGDGGPSSATELADTLARGLGYTDVLYEEGEGKLTALRRRLRSADHEYLIVIDDVNSERDIGQVLRIQSVTDRLLLGTNARELSLRDAQKLVLGPLSEERAVRLLRGFSPPGLLSDQECRSICRALGHHPGSIVLSGRALSEGRTTADKLVNDPDSEFDAGLTVQEKSLLQAFGVFAESGASAAALAAVEGLGEEECLDLLEQLEHAARVERDPVNTSVFKVSQHTRRYSSDDAGIRTERMIAYYTGYARRHQEDFKKLEEARRNLLQAEETACRRGAWRAVHELWRHLELWLDVTGDWGAGQRLLDDALHANRALEEQGVDRAAQLTEVYVVRSALFQLNDRVQEAAREADEARRCAERAGDPYSRVRALVQLAEVHQDSSATSERAHELFQQAWRIGLRLADSPDVPFIAYQLGHSYWGKGRPDLAKKWLRRSLALAEELSGTSLEAKRCKAYALTSLGGLLSNSLARQSRDREERVHQQALDMLLESLRIKTEISERRSRAIALVALADLEHDRPYDRGDLAAASDRLQEAVEIYQGLSAHSGATSTALSQVHQRLGRTHERMGDLGQAVEYETALANYRQALKLTDSRAAPGQYAVRLLDIANVYRSQGNVDEAIRTCQEALRHPDPAGPERVARTHARLGRLWEQKSAQGDAGAAERALSAYRQALALVDSGPYPAQRAELLRNIGDVQARGGSIRIALESYQQSLDQQRLVGGGNRDLAVIHDSRGRAYLQLHELLRSLPGEIEARVAEAAALTACGEPAEAVVLLGHTQDRLWDAVPELGEDWQTMGLHARVCHGLADAYRATGRAADARAALAEAQSCTDMLLEHADRVTSSGWLAVRQGELHQARLLLEEALDLSEYAGDSRGAADVLRGLAEVALAGEEYDRAAGHLGRAADLLTGTDPVGEGETRAGLGRLLRIIDDTQGAASQLRRAAELAHRAGDMREEAYRLEDLGSVLWSARRAAEARACFARVDALRASRGGG
ncbi:hypothetical protein [Streptomyces sp. NPDC050738]|uniref:hypothetical protein n=1 Tax=Streptomyces sp. NPDC050738 TaxID=3154744 RepID=UPI0034203ED2